MNPGSRPQGSVVDQVWVKCGSCVSGVGQVWVRCGSSVDPEVTDGLPVPLERQFL